jgi:phenylalanyl-tRNA synthetase beta chain
VGLGLAEIMNYSFLSEKLLSLVGFGNPAARIALPNPISADHSMLRDSLIPQMLETLGRNRARQAREAALFEMGRVFFKDPSGRYAEEDRVCIGLIGAVGRGGILKQAAVEPGEMFAWIKGILESLLQAQHVPAVTCGGLSRTDVDFRPAAHACFEAGAAVSVHILGAECGVMGLAARWLRDEWRMTEPVAVLELKVEPLASGALRVPAARPIGQYPGVERDVALVADDALSHAAVVETVWKVAPTELVDIRLFDVYRSDSLGKGRKSMAYALTYRAMDRTLTDNETNALHDRVKDALRRDLAADIREN